MTSERIFDRVPPHNIEAEKSVLGALMLEGDSIVKIVDRVFPEDFYYDAHKRIYESMLSLYNTSKVIDVVTVSDELSKSGKLEEVGGIMYLRELVDAVPTAANIEYYANIVKEKALLRALIERGTEIVKMGYEEDKSIDELLDRAERLIFEIGRRNIREGFVHVQEVVEQTFKDMKSLYEEKKRVTGVPSGFVDIDNITAGFQRGSLNVIAARPSMGKTALAIDIARNASMRYGIPVAIFSLEMSKEQIAQRLICSEARIELHKLRTGFIKKDEWPKLVSAVGRLTRAPIYIDESPTITVVELRAKARRLKKEVGIGLIIVDYLQLVTLGRRVDNRQQEVSEISRALKSLARELDIPVIALSQLSRAVEQRNDKRPLLSDLRDSGAIEQDADLVAFIYRDEVYNSKTKDRNIAEIKIAKHRNGATGVKRLAFFKEFTTFEDLASSEISEMEEEM